MSWKDSEAQTQAMVTKTFELTGAFGPVPGIYREPTETSGRLVLLGHGGTANKEAEYIQLMARVLNEKGIATVVIDAPGHGERLDSSITPGPDAFEKMWHGGGGQEAALSDWRMTLDFIEAEYGPRATGWWGLSMGTMIGLPVCATDQRIQVAQLGLMGTWGPNGESLRELAPQMSCPIRFLVQWDDEIVPRDACLELFGLIGSRRKTLHANPGLHSQVPMFEMRESAAYLDKQLG